MEEKVYKTMGHSGALTIAFGIIAIVAGVSCGVMLIVNGGRLLAERSKILL